MFQFARVYLACFGVALPMLAVALLRGLDADPLRLWWLEACVFFGGQCVLRRGHPGEPGRWAYRCTPNTALLVSPLLRRTRVGCRSSVAMRTA
jgi:hypothetical protein